MVFDGFYYIFSIQFSVVDVEGVFVGVMKDKENSMEVIKLNVLDDICISLFMLL